MDHGYDSRHPDLPFTPAAALFTRVISHPAENSPPWIWAVRHRRGSQGQRGIILGSPQAEPVLQSEEHWVWRLAADENTPLPAIGQALYVIPTHICPTCALARSGSWWQRTTGLWTPGPSPPATGRSTCKTRILQVLAICQKPAMMEV